MEQKTIHRHYLGHSIHRNNVDEMNKWLDSQLHPNQKKRLLWITPNGRQTLKKGDMIVFELLQIQLSEGETTTYSDKRVPLAVYSDSNIHRYWSRGYVFMDRNVRIIHPRTSAI